jgi:hypothetical protein
MMARLSILVLLFFFAGSLAPVSARVSVAAYGIDSAAIAGQVRTLTRRGIDSLVARPYSGAAKHIQYNLSKPHLQADRTIDFYLLLLLCLILGAIRYSDPHYFVILIRSFRNASGGRHFKEQIQSATVSNFLMNLFFGVVSGAYIYYAGRLFDVGYTNTYESRLMLLLLVGGMLLIYLVKFFVIRFSGWAFRVEQITEQYLFNVFLINKVIGILLLPFVILLAFAGPQWVGPVVIISLLLVGLLLVNRYTRSWQAFGSFFQYSRFHFFTYLCASEILPMAILVKLLLRSFA